MCTIIQAVLRDETGATIIEYGFTAALIAIGLVAALSALGTSIGNVLNNVTGNM